MNIKFRYDIYTLEAGKTYYFVFENLSKKEIPITFTAKVYDISSFTFNLNKKHTLYQGIDSNKSENMTKIQIAMLNMIITISAKLFTMKETQ